jgi:hypothetical protein
MEELIRKKDAQENDGRIAFNLPVFDQSIVRKKAFKNMRAIQRGNGEQVEQPKPYVHQQHGDEHREVKLPGKKKIPDENSNHQRDSKVCKGTGQGDPETARSWVPEIPRVYGHRFGPSEIEEEKADRAEGIQVADWIESDSPSQFGGGITQGQRSTRMSVLMDGYSKKEHGDLYDPLGNLINHGVVFLSWRAILTGIPEEDKD